MSDGLRRIAAGAAVAFLVALFVIALVRDFRRGPHIDEVEHLNVAVRMVRGETIFVDFAEHHSPLFYALLMPLAPNDLDNASLQAYLARARVLMNAFVALGIVSAALIVLRASGSLATALTFIGLMFAAGGLWRNGLGDVRPDSPAIGVWLAGAALVLLARRAALRGLGIGLVFLSALIAPKWPIASVVVGVYFLASIRRDRRAALEGIAAAMLPAIAGIAALAILSDLRRVVFHIFEVTGAMVGVFEGEWMFRIFPIFYGCPPLMRPLYVVPAAAVTVLALYRARNAFASPRLAGFFLALGAAALAEIRFVYPWPAIDFRYYVLWIVPASALLALLPFSAAALVRVRALIPAAAVLALVAAIDILPAKREGVDPYWRFTAWMRAQMKPGDTVWVNLRRHPIGAPSASYYWFGFHDTIPPSLRVAQTPDGRHFLPRITEEDLPPCRIARGLDRNVRFLSPPRYYGPLPAAARCFETLRVRGIVAPTVMPDVYRVSRY